MVNVPVSGADLRMAEASRTSMLWGIGAKAKEVAVMPWKTKRWDESAEPDDGFRVLICRYRPRALPKKDETWDVWYKELGPSEELHADFYGKNGPPLGWEE